MKREITIGLLCLSLFGCGSRKAITENTESKTNTIETATVKNDIISETTRIDNVITVVTDTTKEIIEETIIETPLQKTTKRKITRNKAIKNEINTNTHIDEKTAGKTTTESKKTQQTKESKQTKNIDRKQFDFIGLILSYWWLWILLAVAILLYKKYKSVLFL